MSARTTWIDAIAAVENETAAALHAQRQAAELRLALRGAKRRGGYFPRENVDPALSAMPVIERALAAYCERLRAERGRLRREE